MSKLFVLRAKFLYTKSNAPQKTFLQVQLLPSLVCFVAPLNCLTIFVGIFCHQRRHLVVCAAGIGPMIDAMLKRPGFGQKPLEIHTIKYGFGRRHIFCIQGIRFSTTNTVQHGG